MKTVSIAKSNPDVSELTEVAYLFIFKIFLLLRISMIRKVFIYRSSCLIFYNISQKNIQKIHGEVQSLMFVKRRRYDCIHDLQVFF